MKANELRIGNYVYSNNKLVEVHCHEILNYWNTDCHNVEPIPLTAEWLLKFGFEHKEEKGTYRKQYQISKYGIEGGKKIAIHCRKDTIEDFWIVTLYEVVYIDDVTPTVLKSVHQLQNLYFALTGKELEIK